jgi:hypothetical protein
MIAKIFVGVVAAVCVIVAFTLLCKVASDAVKLLSQGTLWNDNPSASFYGTKLPNLKETQEPKSLK